MYRGEVYYSSPNNLELLPRLYMFMNETLQRKEEVFIWQAMENFMKWNSNTLYAMCSNNDYAVTCSTDFVMGLMDVLNDFKYFRKITRHGFRIFFTAMCDMIVIFTLHFSDVECVFGCSKKDLLFVTLNNFGYRIDRSVFQENEDIHCITALRGNLKLMKLLVHYGFLASLSPDSSFMNYETRKIISCFM